MLFVRHIVKITESSKYAERARAFDNIPYIFPRNSPLLFSSRRYSPPNASVSSRRSTSEQLNIDQSNVFRHVYRGYTRRSETLICVRALRSCLELQLEADRSFPRSRRVADRDLDMLQLDSRSSSSCGVSQL